MSPGPIRFGHQATVSSADGPGSRLVTVERRWDGAEPSIFRDYKLDDNDASDDVWDQEVDNTTRVWGQDRRIPARGAQRRGPGWRAVLPEYEALVLSFPHANQQSWGEQREQTSAASFNQYETGLAFAGLLRTVSSWSD